MVRFKAKEYSVSTFASDSLLVSLVSCVYAQLFSLCTVGPLYSELVSGFVDLYGRL